MTIRLSWTDLRKFDAKVKVTPWDAYAGTDGWLKYTFNRFATW
jgi:hypothetical protein